VILVAPTALKGTIGARAAAAAIAAGVRALGLSDVVELPVSDGGPGLIDALAGEAKVEQVIVSGPLGERARARVLLRAGLAVVESADACGLHLVPEERRNPLHTSTYGVGELIRSAAARAPGEIVVGLGGSATIDCGIGMAAALGWQFLDELGDALVPMPESLAAVRYLRPPAQALERKVRALVDVETRLTGFAGAAHVFGPQKGAPPAVIEQLDRGLDNLARVIERDLGKSVRELHGGGAAGGLGAGLHAFLNADISLGSDWVLEHVDFDRHLRDARLLITAEGSFDSQSSLGKITGAVISRAQAAGIPVLLIAGRVEGPLPAGVHAVAGRAGETLRPGDLTDLTRTACSELLPL
jgi:glycerate kinase